MGCFLDSFVEEIGKREGANVFFVGEYRDGVYEHRALARTSPCQNVYSVAKAYIVTAVGLLWDRGLLSTDEILADILADELPPTYDPIWDKTTVEMLLLHRVGLSKGFLDIDTHDATAFGEDYLAYVLNAPIDPTFDLLRSTYTDAAYYLLSRIVEKRAGMGADDFLWRHLFLHTGCREAAWSHCPMGHAMGATGLYIRVEELLKLGAIYLSGGLYKETRILSQEWVDTVLTRGYELKPKCGGMAYGKGGMRGQMLMVVPDTGRVVAWTGCGSNDFTDFVASYRA